VPQGSLSRIVDVQASKLLSKLNCSLYFYIVVKISILYNIVILLVSYLYIRCEK